jgi:hypothetical protein
MVRFLTELTEDCFEEEEQPPSLNFEDDVPGKVEYLDDYVRKAETLPDKNYHHLTMVPTSLELFVDVLSGIDDNYLTALFDDADEHEYNYYLPFDGDLYSPDEEGDAPEAAVEKDFADYIVCYQIQSPTIGDNPMEFQFEDGDDCTREARLYLVELQTSARIYDQKARVN